ncbi:MAG: hypothetical protein K1X79_09450 [Oligoflexia bacterium]|nr:hypothetical protein [Oligoflexia bacterium]
MTISKRLTLMLVINLTVTLVVAGVGYWGIDGLSLIEADIVVNARASHHQQNVDMMHDALRADVYASLLNVAKQEGAPSMDDVLSDLAEHTKTMRDELASLRELSLGADLTRMLNEVEPKVEAYTAAAQEFVKQVAASGAFDSTALNRFSTAFSELEERLGGIGDSIVSQNNESESKGEQMASRAHWAMWILCSLGVLVGSGLSWWMSKSMSRSLNRIIAGLDSAVARTQAMNSQLRSSSQSVAEGATEQAAAVQETVASMAQMSSMVAQTVENARKSLDVATKVTERTEEGSRTMERMVSSMETIQQANQQLQEMANIIREISTKTGVINDIVFKTQLLAFNASIEAARAGQHGRGFAVVAEEVGNLAEMSGNAAKEIQVLLESSQKQVGQIVEDTERRVGEGQQVSREAMDTFAQIAKEVFSISSQVQSINDATREQELGIKQAGQAMNQMDIATQRNSGVAIETAQAVEQLTKESEALHAIVGELQHMVVGAAVAQVMGQSVAAEPVKSVPEAAHTNIIELNNPVSSQSSGDLTGLADKILAAKKATQPAAKRASVSADDSSFQPLGK